VAAQFINQKKNSNLISAQPVSTLTHSWLRSRRLPIDKWLVGFQLTLLGFLGCSLSHQTESLGMSSSIVCRAEAMEGEQSFQRWGKVKSKCIATCIQGRVVELELGESKCLLSHRKGG
jgi:hypothetical protein